MMVSSPSLSLWKNRHYLPLLLAQVISLAGTGISSVCLALLAYDLAKADASVVLSIAFALKMLAYIVLAPVFSVLNQRWPKRNALVVLDLIRACLVIGLPFVTEVWQVYVLMFLINTCSAAFTPLYQATLPQVLPDRDDYTRALSNSRIAYDLEQILSPMLSAVLLSVVSFHLLFWIDAMTFVVSALLILQCFVPAEEVPSKQVERLNWRTLADGIIGYLSQPTLRSLWYAYLATAAASAMVIVNTVVYVHEILGGGSSETALAMLAVGLGSMLVAVSLPRVVSNLFRCQSLGLLLICAAFYLGTWLPSWLGFVVLCFLFGVGMSCIQTTSGLIINDASNGGDASKLFAAHFSLTHFWWLLTYLIAGLSASLWGLAGAYWLMLLIAVISSLAFVLQRARGRDAMGCKS